jgi:hypothetical protein
MYITIAYIIQGVRADIKVVDKRQPASNYAADEFQKTQKNNSGMIARPVEQIFDLQTEGENRRRMKRSSLGRGLSVPNACWPSGCRLRIRDDEGPPEREQHSSIASHRVRLRDMLCEQRHEALFLPV